MKHALLALAVVLAACGPAPDRDATQDATGTTGRQAGEITVTGCLAFGQMGTYMLTPENALPEGEGLGRGAATTGYQLLGQPDDFNQYMNKRVRVTGTRDEQAQGRPDSNAAPQARDGEPDRRPWPQLQVREIDPLGEECGTTR